MKNMIRDMADAAGLTFRELVRIQFDAPWKAGDCPGRAARIATRPERIGRLW